MATIPDLPPEILSHILSFLPAEYLAVASRVCKRFKEASSVDSVWQNRCQSDFRISELDQNASYYEVYTKILYPYGYALGLWQADMDPYGGLLQVKFDGDKLVATQFLPPVEPDIEDPLRAKIVFSVKMGTDGATSLMCHRGYNGTHDCCIEQKNGLMSVRCANPSYHRDPNGEQQEFRKWLVEETKNDLGSFFMQGQELLLQKFRTMIVFDKLTKYRRLEIPPRRSDVPIQPGLFKGNYGGHGIELIMVTYNEDNTQMNAVKITGDPNVPATKITVKAYLTRPMILQLNQQDSIETLSEIDTADLPPDMKIDEMPTQPFAVPMGCLDRHASPPARCKSRFHSHGHIAHDGFRNDEFIPGHWVVFDEDTFGHLWLELRSFSLFSRVKEDL